MFTSENQRTIMNKGVLLFATLCIIHANSLCQLNQYLAYDGFNYTSETSLHGQYGGTGWLEPWEIQVGNTTLPGYGNHSNNLLSFSDLLAQGGYVDGGLQYLSIGRKLDLSDSGPFVPFRNQNGRLGKNETTVYFSFLIRKNENNDDAVIGMLQGGNNVPWVPNANPRIMMGYFGSISNNSGLKYWGIQINDSSFLSSKEIVIGESVLLVCRIDFFTASSNVKFWVNPLDIGGQEPQNAEIDINLPENLEFLSFAGTLGYSPDQASLDEIRIGENYATVTPTLSTPLNSPPIASFTNIPSNGISPLTVSFDGSLSVDPEGQLFPQYIWNYGDGSKDTTAIPSTSHTYTDLGIFTTSLRIADSLALSHTAYSVVKVTDENGFFPCHAYVECYSHASCDQNNGSFRVFASGCSYQLFNSLNQEITTADANNIYDSLAVDSYVLYLQSVEGCRDTLHLYIQTDSTTCEGYEIPDCLNLGINLDGTSYYDRQKIFKNFFNDASEWLSFNASGSSPWNTEVADEIPKDQNGYPLEIPYNTSIGAQKIRTVISAGGHMQPGQYVLKYDGQGTLEVVSGVTITNSIPGRIDFSINTGYFDNIYIDIHTSQQGDHLRNIRIVRSLHDNDNLENPFYEEFLNKIAPFSTIRFMDVMATNTTNNPVEWIDRKNDLYYSQSIGSGMSYEYIVKMGNISRKNIWINIPHTGNEDYVRQMARFFRDSLSCDLDIYLEYSNEVWNWMFPQAHAVADEEPQNIPYPRRYAERCRWAFAIWMEEFGIQSPRLHRVLNTQSYYPWYGEEVLAHLDQSEYDYLSPAWYFSYGGPCLTMFDSTTSVSEIIDCSREYFYAMLPTIRKDYLNAHLYGKKIVNYEGGQHMTNFYMTPYTQTVWQTQLDPLIYDLYDEVIDTLKKMGTDMAIAYNLARVNETIWGSFGHLSDIDISPSLNTAPKYLALIDNTCSYLPPSQDTIEQVIQACNSIEWIDGVMYTNDTSGVYYSLSNYKGCDSVVELNLTITPLYVEVVPNENSLTAVTSQLDSIQWYDCQPFLSIIPGENQLSFFPSQTGEYSAAVYYGDCLVQSDCMPFPNTSLLSETSLDKITVFPNPTGDKCFTVLSDIPRKITIYDTKSQEIWRGTVKNGEKICLTSVQKGMYFLKNDRTVIKITLL